MPSLARPRFAGGIANDVRWMFLNLVRRATMMRVVVSRWSGRDYRPSWI